MQAVLKRVFHVLIAKGFLLFPALYRQLFLVFWDRDPDYKFSKPYNEKQQNECNHV